MFSTGFCICEQENFFFTPQENIWFYEVRETRLDVIIRSGGIQRLKGQGYSKSYSYGFYRSR